MEGKAVPFHRAPEWLMDESAGTLGRIHTALSGFRKLPVGMGEGFLNFMASEHPLDSYRRTREQAAKRNDPEILVDVEYRLSVVNQLKKRSFELSKFTRRNTPRGL